MYVQKTIVAGNFIYIKKYHAGAYGNRTQKSERKKPTPERVAKINENNAIERLSWLLNANFKRGNDSHCTLTYKNETLPKPDEAKNILAGFLRKLRKEYKKAGKELKYVSVTEYKNKRLHHHIVLNDTNMLSEVMRLWDKYGRVHAKILYTDDLSELAEYLIKETSKTFRSENAIHGRRYTASKNLTQPKITIERIYFKKWRKPRALYKQAKLITYHEQISDYDNRPMLTAVYFKE